MTESKINRLNQWFVRGIGIISAGLFGMVFFLVFLEINQDSFYSGPNQTEVNYAIIGQEIGRNLWTFRVYDLLLILIIISLAIMGSYYLVNFEVIKQPQKQTQQQRRRYY